MELKEAIDKLFEMTDKQRYEIFNFADAEGILNSYTMSYILETIKNFYSEPKYGDVYLSKDGHKIIILSNNYCLSEKYECPQNIEADYIVEYYTKTGKNVAYELRNLFK